MNHVKHPWSSADIRIPSLEIQEIQIETAIWYIISNSFNFFWAFKDFFSKYGYNFDDVSKNGYSMLSWNKVILK